MSQRGKSEKSEKRATERKIKVGIVSDCIAAVAERKRNLKKVNPFVLPGCQNKSDSGPKTGRKSCLKTTKLATMRAKGVQTNLIEYGNKLTQVSNINQHQFNGSSLEELKGETDVNGLRTLSMANLMSDNEGNLSSVELSESDQEPSNNLTEQYQADYKYNSMGKGSTTTEPFALLESAVAGKGKPKRSRRQILNSFHSLPNRYTHSSMELGSTGKYPDRHGGGKIGSCEQACTKDVRNQSCKKSNTEMCETIICRCDLCPDTKRGPPIRSPYVKCDKAIYEDSTDDRAQLTSASNKNQVRRSTSGSSPLEEDDIEIIKPVFPGKMSAMNSRRNSGTDQKKAETDLQDAINKLADPKSAVCSRVHSTAATPLTRSNIGTPKVPSKRNSADADGRKQPKINLLKLKSEPDTKKANGGKGAEMEALADSTADKEQTDSEKKSDEENNNCCSINSCPKSCGCCCPRYFMMCCKCCKRCCMMRPQCKGPCCCRPPTKCCCCPNR